MLSQARHIWVFICGWAFTVFYAIVCVSVSLLTLGLGRRLVSPALMRGYGKSMLWIQGIRVAIDHPERLTAPGPKLIVTNHSSSLDIFLFCAVMPSRSTVIGKRELLFVPFMGLAIWAIGVLLVDRSNPEKSRQTIARAAKVLCDEKLTVLIAPEGTRSADGTLSQFKLGAFRLALASGAPIVPLVIHGAWPLQPVGKLTPSSGQVWMRVLEPMSTDHFDPDTLGAEADRLRAVYEAELESLERAHPTRA